LLRDQIRAIVQNGLTFIKIFSLLLLVFLSLWLSDGSYGTTTQILSFSSHGIPLSGLVAAVVAVLWAYDGWIEITFVAGEVRQPERAIHRSLIISTLMVIGLYVLVNVAYLAVLPVAEMARSLLVASDAMKAILGAPGASIIAAAVIISAFGANNGFVITGARIYYAMAKDRMFFASFGQVHAHFATPVPSLLGQGLWASVLVLTGTYEQLFTYVVFASWIFYAMSSAGVLILRKRNPEAPRPYRTWGYPVTPIVFIVFALTLVVVSILENPRDSLVGLAMILSGLPAYWYWKRKETVLRRV
jgi:APA family basic amino acid/polyamine antiporter